MTKSLVVLVLIAACGRGGVPVTPSGDHGPRSLAEVSFAHVVGESMAWEVYWQAMLVGRAELTVDQHQTRGTFRTSVLARAVTSFSYDLVTPRERDARAAPGGGRLHSLSTALAVIRAWARPGAQPGYLWLIHEGDLYRLDVPVPVRDEALAKPALRIDAIVRSFDRTTELDVSIWLGLDTAHTPLRFVVQAGGDRIAAELVESTTL